MIFCPIIEVKIRKKDLTVFFAKSFLQGFLSQNFQSLLNKFSSLKIGGHAQVTLQEYQVSKREEK